MAMINQFNAVCIDQNRFEADASDLGLKPGFWPEYMSASIGNDCHFYIIETHEENGEITKCIYQQPAGGSVLTLWND